jgi:hypothetical protein
MTLILTEVWCAALFLAGTYGSGNMETPPGTAPADPAQAQPASAPSGNPELVIHAGPKGSLSVGAQRKQQVGGMINFKYEPNQADGATGPHQRLKLDINADNTLVRKPGSSVRTHEYNAELNYLYYLRRHMYLVGIAEGYHNSSLTLYLQQSYGGGIGGSWTFAQDRQKLELAGDVRAITEHFYASTPAVVFAGVRIGGEYVVKFGSAATSAPELSISAKYIPAIDQDKAWQARGRASLAVPIGKHFSMIVAVTDDYLENTPRKNYSSSSVGMTFDFRK